MGQKGAHTWDLFLHYHRCPQCGYVFESRKAHEYVLGKYQKEESCPRCAHRFMHYRAIEPSFGPLIGEPQPAETEWGD